MKNTLFYLFILFAISISCKKKSDVDSTQPIIEETKYFNFTVGPNYNIDNDYQRIRNWVLVYSEENELLINLKLENENEYSYNDLELPQSGLTLQIITYEEQRGINDTVFNRQDKVSFITYKNLMPSHWKFAKNESKEYEPIGTFNVELQGFELGDFHLSEMKSSYEYSNSIYNSNEYQLKRYIDKEYLWLFAMNENEAPNFKKISNIVSDTQFIINNNDLIVMNDYVDVTLPQNESMFVYLESEDDYSSEFWDYNAVFYNYFDGGETSIRAYNPGEVFPGYYSYYRARKGNVNNYQLTSRGNIPNQLKTLDFDLNLDNSNIYDFKATVTGNADLGTLRWKYDSVDEEVFFEYRVNFPLGSEINFSAPSIPENVIDQLPLVFDINSFEYDYFLANEYDVFNGYQDYIQSYYIDNFDLYSQRIERQWQYIYQNSKSMEENNDKEIIESLKRNPYE
ncbi:hypothetical protein HNS38_04475 [Lentimicrobium sp. L6]|uniref:hypothetical protein n=1 Tax=Lentimicrobium sp. L6 TaxID=2735916 RepID=UPI001552C27F|nr:hypothetical protein [Lentimicrobium sp. L6]NPD84000.1 hypothetical protein [Lentimicrobium sp. L6]